jgi:trk system potassium uptake protein TrkH
MGRIEKRLSSSQIIILGFAGVILLGALILMLPISSQSGTVTPFLDCLFTSTSAVCVTGLVVYDTATHWTIFGQAVIIALIQIGGMGVITVAAVIAMAAN